MKQKNECKNLKLLPTDSIKVGSQPRKNFDEYELARLADSIRQNGILQPLSVRRVGNEYLLIAGERRLRAAKTAGLKKVPCIIFSCSDALAATYAVIENLQRCELSFFEEADGINRLITEHGLSQAEIAERLGIAQSTLSNKLRLLHLSEPLRERIVGASLTSRHARALLSVTPERREETLNHIIANRLNIKQTEDYIDSVNNPPPPEAQQKRKGALSDIRLFTNSLSRLVDTMVLSGIPAKQETRERKDYIEYKVKIPKPPEDACPSQLKLSV